MAKSYWYPRPYGWLHLIAENVPDFLQRISHIVPNAEASAVVESEGEPEAKAKGE